MKKYVMLSVIFSFIIVASGCAKSVNKLNEQERDYSVAVMRTPKTDSLFRKTKIELYDKDLKLIKVNKYLYGGVGRTNWGLPFKEGKYVYELSLGYGVDEEDCKVLQLNSKNGKIKEYKVCKHVNDIYVDGRYIYGIANLNGDTTVSRTTIKDNKIEEIEVKNEMCMECCIYNGSLYRLTDWKNGRIFLAEVDFDEKGASVNKIELTKYIDEDTEPSSFYDYKDKLYVPAKENLLCIKNNKVKKTKIKVLDNTNPRLLKGVGKYLYMAVSSLFAENDNSKIIKYNMDSDKIEAEYNINSCILQFDVVGTDLYVINFDNELVKYKIEKGNLIEKNKIELEVGDEEYLSAMYAK
ncbi:MAG: hypothetical protein HFG30_04195 [Eubacterium sp.]|nr:hypothetical protein [Eubacterium sp.]